MAHCIEKWNAPETVPCKNVELQILLFSVATCNTVSWFHSQWLQYSKTLLGEMKKKLLCNCQPTTKLTKTVNQAEKSSSVSLMRVWWATGSVDNRKEMGSTHQVYNEKIVVHIREHMWRLWLYSNLNLTLTSIISAFAILTLLAHSLRLNRASPVLCFVCRYSCLIINDFETDDCSSVSLLGRWCSATVWLTVEIFFCTWMWVSVGWC